MPLDKGLSIADWAATYDWRFQFRRINNTMSLITVTTHLEKPRVSRQTYRQTTQATYSKRYYGVWVYKKVYTHTTLISIRMNAHVSSTNRYITIIKRDVKQGARRRYREGDWVYRMIKKERERENAQESVRVCAYTYIRRPPTYWLRTFAFKSRIYRNIYIYMIYTYIKQRY